MCHRLHQPGWHTGVHLPEPFCFFPLRGSIQWERCVSHQSVSHCTSQHHQTAKQRTGPGALLSSCRHRWVWWSISDILCSAFSKLSHVSPHKAVQSTDCTSATQPTRRFLGTPFFAMGSGCAKGPKAPFRPPAHTIPVPLQPPSIPQHRVLLTASPAVKLSVRGTLPRHAPPLLLSTG